MIAHWRSAATALLLACTPLVVVAENGVTDTTVLIGRTIGITGQIAGAVKELNEGAHAHIDSINKRGGIHGRRVEIRTLDDKFDPATSATNASILIKNHNVFALIHLGGIMITCANNDHAGREYVELSMVGTDDPY